VTQIDLATAETDPATVGHGDRLIVKRVRQLVQAAVNP